MPLIQGHRSWWQLATLEFDVSPKFNIELYTDTFF